MHLLEKKEKRWGYLGGKFDLLSRFCGLQNLEERERFELSIPLTGNNGFQDRRIRPLCHLSTHNFKLITGLLYLEVIRVKPEITGFLP